MIGFIQAIVFASYIAYVALAIILSFAATNEYLMRKNNYLTTNKIPVWKLVVLVFCLGPVGWIVSIGTFAVARLSTWYLNE